jgi:hypothetical protein
MLKLIVNNTKNATGDNLPRRPRKKAINPKVLLERLFLYDFRELTSNLHILRCHDFSHKLACEMTLERTERLAYTESMDDAEEGYGFVTVIAADFPSIDIQKLMEKVNGDTYLQEVLLTRFHLNLLEQLLLFCKKKEATHLILILDNDELDYLQIYRDFLISEEEVMTSHGEQTEVIIPTNRETYAMVTDYMEKLNQDFQQTLWREQKNNSTMRKYLKFQSLLEFL